MGITISPKTGQEIIIHGSEKLQRAIRSICIDAIGDLTFSDSRTFKSSRYTIHFLKPVAFLQDAYNLGNEVLILGTNDGMREFSSRTKDFMDFVLNTAEEFRNRLDKVVCIVIDDNPNIVSLIKADRASNPDVRLLIPFSTEELQNGITENDFQNRLREFLYQKDLFGIATPLTSSMFFFGKDRNDIISELYGRYIQGEPGGLFGLRRIGKTSVLNLLKNRINTNNGLAVYFDCSRYHHKHWYSFLEDIIAGVRIAKDNADGQITRKVLDIYHGESPKYTAENAIDRFERDIEQLYSDLGNVRVLFIFDEIEKIGFGTSPSDHWKTGADALFFWEALRSITQTDNRFFTYVIAGVNPQCIEIPSILDSDNPIFGSMRPIYMSLFNYDDIKQMTSRIGGYLGLSFEEPVYAKLQDDYGGHPFLTRQVCSRIHMDLLESKTLRPTTVTSNYYDLHRDEYQGTMIQVIEQILEVLQKSYSNEYDLLKKLALNGRKAFKKEIRGNETEIQHLLGYCLVEKAQDEYFLRIKSIENYMQNKYAYDKDVDTLKEKINQINDRRGAIELKLRQFVKTQLVTKYGKRAKQQLADFIKNTSNDKSQPTKIINSKDLSSALEELYLNQLGEIMKKNWKDYQTVFPDKVAFEYYFKVLNDTRNLAAHYKSIDDDAEVLYRMTFKYFEEALEDLG